MDAWRMLACSPNCWCPPSRSWPRSYREQTLTSSRNISQNYNILNATGEKMLISKPKLRSFFCSFLFLAFCYWPTESWSAEWTIMIYMNGKNNLESDAIDNFIDMTTVKDNPQVNLIVEMGRPESHYTEGADNWSGVLRFRVQKGTRPVPENALMDVAKAGGNTDMGVAETLADFVKWTIENYPAKKYAIVIWNHGQGWRYQ